MLSVAQAVHHPAETPASASQHAALVHPQWSSGSSSSMLKRRNTEPDCCIISKKPSPSHEKNYLDNIQVGPEVTLTLISKNNGSTGNFKNLFKGEIKIPNSFEEDGQKIDCDARVEAEEEEEEEEATPAHLTQVLTYFENSKEIELTRIKPAASVKVVGQDELLDVYSPDEDDDDIKVEKKSDVKNVKNDVKPDVKHDIKNVVKNDVINGGDCLSEIIALEETVSETTVPDHLPELTIEPRSGTSKANLQNISDNSKEKESPVNTPRRITRTRSKLDKAANLLEQSEVISEPFINCDFDYYNNSGSLISSPAAQTNFKSNRVDHVETIPDENSDLIICPSLFNEKLQVPITTVSDTAACDYDPFSNVGVSVETYWTLAKERPYYVHGLPNPASENRCWINATLQALFRLPVFKDLSSPDVSKYSKLIKSLANVQNCWMKGMTRNQGYNSSFHHFKDELSVLDKGYPSKAQQDVSEFLLNLLNFIKTEFETKPKETHNNEIENIPNNEQDTPKKSQSTSLDTSKRSPLADISASAGQPRNSSQVASNSEQQDSGSTKASSASKSQSDNEAETKPNAIDDNFLMHMVENYTCCQCANQRQNKVENLMLFVDLPSEDWGDTLNLVQLINTTCGTEQREMTCELCKHNRHTMDTRLKKLPKVLTVQVKRYEMTNEGIITKKCTAIDIPQLLNIDALVIHDSQEFSHPPTYEPVGIISHIGDSIDSGHYISFVKHEDQWFYYDDADVKILTEDEVFKSVKNNAYVIFFQDTESCKNEKVEAEQTKGG